MSFFRPPDELKKTLHQIYAFGLIGLFVKIYAVKPGDVPLSPIKNDSFNLAAICGLAVFYLGVTYLLRYINEYLSYLVNYLDAATEKLRVASNLQELRTIISDPEMQGIVAALQKKQGRYTTGIRFSAGAVFAADIVAPVLFILLCCAELTRPVINFLIDLWCHL